MGSEAEPRRSRPDQVNEAYLAQLLIDECLNPAAGPDVARAIISILVTAGSLAPSPSDGLAFASRPERTNDLPSAVAKALFDEFQRLLDTDRMPWFAARSGRLLRPGTITPMKGAGGWRQIDDPLLIFDCHQDDPLRELLSEAKTDFDRLTWFEEAIVAEFADRRIGSFFTGFLLRDAKGRIEELEAEIYRQARPSTSIAAHADKPREISEQLIASHSITQVTRRDIVAAICDGGFDWCGRMDALEFLKPLYDLELTPSRDRPSKNARDDIVQHRINNEDWPSNWIFADERFDPLRPECTDDEFLRFLCRTLHPEVRPTAAEAREWAAIFNGFLNVDGWQLGEEGSISGRPTFAPRRSPTAVEPLRLPAPTNPAGSHDEPIRDGTPAAVGPPERLRLGWKAIRAAIKQHGIDLSDVTDETLREWAKRGKLPVTVNPKGGRPQAWDEAIQRWCAEGRRRKEAAVDSATTWLDSVERAAEEGGTSLVRPAEATEHLDLKEVDSIGRRESKDLPKNADRLSRVTRRGQSRR